MDIYGIFKDMAGVWDGTYTHIEPDGSLIEKYVSRQEARLIGTEWYERIVYERATGTEVHDFRATIVDNEVRFEDDNFVGTDYQVTDNILVFPYYWKDKPDWKIVETIVMPTPDLRTRLWVHYDHDVLVKLTIIDEKRNPSRQPEVWG